MRAEGWKWVEAVAGFGYSELATFRRAPQIEREPTARQAKRLATLQARQEVIEDALHAAEKTEDEDGQDNSDGGAEATPAKTLSERLVRNLSVHRTAALQAVLATKPDVALAALVHRLALTVFYHGGDSLLQIAVYPQDGLTQQAPELAESKAAAEFNALRTAWRERLPADDADLFDALRQMKRADLLALLAVCVASTVDAVARSEHDSRAEVNRVAGYKKPDMARVSSAK